MMDLPETYAEMTSGYRDRMRRLALFDPLNDLDKKRSADDEGIILDMRGLGMLTLLFFFERRLTREYKTGVVDLVDFLLKVTRDTYTIERPTLEKLAREIIQVFRPPTGKRRTFSFFNWETREQEVIEYSMLKDNGFDPKTQTQYYTLDDDGLEFLFATKEFYNEFQISINQLLLKQQIKKGEFHGALRQIREMDIDVDVLKEKMQKMKLEILRSIVSEETFERYKKLLEDTHLRFEQEDEEFKTLTQFIKETRELIYSGDLQREETSYRLITKIAKELEQVHYEHTRLLELTADLRTTALLTAQESLYYTGIQSFNFNQDIVSQLLAKPLNSDKMKGILHPFLRVEENLSWSPLSIFAPQNITEEKPEQEETGFAEVQDSTDVDAYQEWMAQQYAVIMEKFIAAYENDQANTLKDWMKDLQETDPELLNERTFYAFWLYMYQLSPVTRERTENDEGQNIIEQSLDLLKDRQLIIEKLPGIINLTSRYSIQNLQLTLEGDR